MLTGFKNFLMRGNVVELAVAVIMAGAFSRIVTALTEGLITPLISALFGKPNLDEVWKFTVNHSEFKVGMILTAIINFLLIATAVYFLIVLPLNKFAARFAPSSSVPAEQQLLTEIRDLLRDQQRR